MMSYSVDDSRSYGKSLTQLLNMWNMNFELWRQKYRYVFTLPWLNKVNI